MVGSRDEVRELLKDHVKLTLDMGIAIRGVVMSTTAAEGTTTTLIGNINTKYQNDQLTPKQRVALFRMFRY